MPGPTPHYPPVFEREAVESYRSSEKSIPKIAKELGIADESLRRRVRQHQIGPVGVRQRRGRSR
jgi:transposase